MGRRASALSRHVEKAVKSYNRRVAAFNAARAEVDAKRLVNPAAAEDQAVKLAVQAEELRAEREGLAVECRNIGLGFDLPMVAG